MGILSFPRRSKMARRSTSNSTPRSSSSRSPPRATAATRARRGHRPPRGRRSPPTAARCRWRGRRVDRASPGGLAEGLEVVFRPPGAPSPERLCLSSGHCRADFLSSFALPLASHADVDRAVARGGSLAVQLADEADRLRTERREGGGLEVVALASERTPIAPES